MQWDPLFEPRLRPLEAFPLADDHGATVGLRDPSGLSDVVLALSPAAASVMAMMDGTRTCEQIRQLVFIAAGEELPVHVLQSMLEQLANAHFLDGPEFDAYYGDRLSTYRHSDVRTLPPQSALRIVDGEGAIFDDMLRDVPDTARTKPVLGLIAPHLDYPRGRPCYASAYAELRSRRAPDRVVVLGTNHFGRSASVVATGNDFETPLGRTRVDVAFLERLEARCGDLRACELDHAAEHSVELQLAWLQHLFGSASFELVPFLCPDPCGPTGTAPRDGRGVDLGDFAQALRGAIEADPCETLIIAGADLSHTGASFGDERPLDEGFLAEVKARDECALERLVTSGPDAWVRCVAEENNPTRVCSAGCVFVLATVLPRARRQLLQYHQAVDQSTQTCVTCAAVSFD